ncbi:MAG TPA: hypothetical protein VNQ77_00420 [Frankiaceae bacterium]|nr:hypothetical protein [Frankiaceae bacterium]
MLLVAATFGAQPAAPAAEPAMVVYEITRARSGGPSSVPLYVVTESDGTPGVMSFLQLAPRKGGGWTRTRFMVGMYNPSDTRTTVYGGPVKTPPLTCPVASDVCGQKGDPSVHLFYNEFRPGAGNRYFVALQRGTGMIFTTQHWRVRQTSLGARVVSGPGGAAAAAGVDSTGRWVESFVSATAPGGKYGSGVFAMAPCKGDTSVGTATVKSDGSDRAAEITCEPGGYHAAFSGTLDGRTWTMQGPVVGETEYPNRLLVFDYPKR